MSKYLQVKIDFNSNLQFAVELTLLDKSRGWEVRQADDCGFIVAQNEDYLGCKSTGRVVYVTSTVANGSVYPTMVLQQAGRPPRMRESRLTFGNGLPSLDKQMEALTKWVNQQLEMAEVVA